MTARDRAADAAGPSHRRGLARNSGAIAVLAAAGVLTGFLVDAAMAALFGAGPRTDAFFIAATIPFALASLLLASANQVLVPLINGWFADDPDEAERRVGSLLGTALTVAVGVAVVGVAVSPFLPRVLAPGSSEETKVLASAISALLFVTVITRVGAEVLRSLLNARFSFAAPASMAIVENGSVLITTLLLARRLGVPAVAVGYVVGGVLQFSYMALVARARGLRFRPRVAPRDPEIRRAMRLLALPVAGTGLNMVARATERFLASFLPAGSITILNYAWVIVNSLGGAIFFRSVVVALLPRLAQARRDDGATRGILSDGVKIMALVSLPLTAFVLVLAHPFVTFAFQRGAFTPESAALLASVLSIYALQFPLDALTRVFLSFWYSRLNTVTPFKNVALGVGLDIAFAAALFVPFGIEGIAAAYALSSIGNLAHAIWTVRRAIDLQGGPLLPFIGKVAAASAVAGGASAGILAVLPPGTGIVERGVRLAVPGIAGLAALVIGLLVLRVRVWRTLLGRAQSPPVRGPSGAGDVAPAAPGPVDPLPDEDPLQHPGSRS
jgi:putative peptidoglycan lipid II flippase